MKALRDQFTMGLFAGAFGVGAYQSLLADWMGLDKWQQFEQGHWSSGWMAAVGDIGMLMAFILFCKLAYDARSQKTEKT